MRAGFTVLFGLSLFLAVGGRTGLADDPLRPSNVLLRTMTDAAGIGTDEAFQTLKEQRGFRPETLAPKGLRSLMEEPKLPLRGLHAAWRHEKGAAALSWWSELESDQEVADLASLVRERLEGGGYTEGEAPTDEFFRSPFRRFRFVAKEVLTFRREVPPCRELIAVVLLDRNAQADSKVRLGIQWYVVGSLGEESLTLKTLGEDFPMLASSALDPRILEAIVSAPVAEFETSLQLPEKDPAAPRRSILGRRNWTFETPRDLRTAVKAPLTAAGYAVAETTQLGGDAMTESWRRNPTEYINVLSSTVPLVRTRLSIVSVDPSRNAARSAATQKPSVRTRPAGASSTPRPLAELMPTLIRDAEIGTDSVFDTFKEDAGLVSGTVAPKGFREFLTRPGYGTGSVHVGVAAKPESLSVSWFAEVHLGQEIVSTPEQIQEEAQGRLEKLGFARMDEAVLEEMGLASMRSRVKSLLPYQRIQGTTSELAVVAISDRKAIDNGSICVALIWSVEAPHPATPFTLAEVIEALPPLQPAELDPAVVKAVSAAPLDRWERTFADPSRRKRQPPGVLHTLSNGWTLQFHADLQAQVKEALAGVGFQSAPQNDTRSNRFTVESWKREYESVTVQYIEARPVDTDQRPLMSVSGVSFPPVARPRR